MEWTGGKAGYNRIEEVGGGDREGESSRCEVSWESNGIGWKRISVEWECVGRSNTGVGIEIAGVDRGKESVCKGNTGIDRRQVQR